MLFISSHFSAINLKPTLTSAQRIILDVAAKHCDIPDIYIYIYIYIYISIISYTREPLGHSWARPPRWPKSLEKTVKTRAKWPRAASGWLVEPAGGRESVHEGSRKRP